MATPKTPALTAKITAFDPSMMTKRVNFGINFSRDTESTSGLPGYAQSDMLNLNVGLLGDIGTAKDTVLAALKAAIAAVEAFE